MSGAPLVSVVTPCHDAEAFVGETIESVLAQTHPSVEQVIVDDGSTDGSWSVIEGYARKHPERIRALRLDRNRGGCHARNRGAEIARGEYLMFLDADDLIAPDTLAALVEAARREPGSIAYCDCRDLREGASGDWVDSPRDIPIPAPDFDLFHAFLTQAAWIPTCSVLWRRDALAMSGGWDEEMARDQDTDLMLRACASGVRLVRAAGGTGYYRRYGAGRASVSGSPSEAKLRASIRVLDKLTDELARLGRLQEYAVPLNWAYRRRALHGFRHGYVALARQALQSSERLAAAQPVSATPAGRVLERVLGLERKEQVSSGLARLRTMAERRQKADGALVQSAGPAT